MKNKKSKKQIIIDEFKDKIHKSCGFPMEGTMWRGEESENSYALVIKGAKQPKDNLKDKNGNDLPKEEKRKRIEDCKSYVRKTLQQDFGIKLPDEDLDIILNGEGSEWRKMRTINSSSLCGYLHFHNVSEANPFYLPINGKHQEYTKAYFEFENPCVGSHPSSVDVVLTNKKKKSVLFLELKFTEYLNGGAIKLSKEYINEYEKLFGKINISKKDDEQKLFDSIFIKNIGDKDYWQLKSNAKRGEKPYVGGLKQVISHCIGIRNFIKFNKKYNKESYEYGDRNRRPLGFKPSIIRYAEMSFVLPGAEEAFKRFSDCYKSLVKDVLKSEFDKIEFVKDVPFTYQDVFKDPMNKKVINNIVKRFYYDN